MKNQFLEYCSTNKFQHNDEQIEALALIVSFYKQKNFFVKYFMKSDKKLGFYLQGDVGVGKTMLLNFFFDHLDVLKQRMHFNEFMISFHDFRHNYKLKKKNNSIEAFVKKIKKKGTLFI